jgi:hypothetical protein
MIDEVQSKIDSLLLEMLLNKATSIGNWGWVVSKL